MEGKIERKRSVSKERVYNGYMEMIGAPSFVEEAIERNEFRRAIVEVLLQNSSDFAMLLYDGCGRREICQRLRINKFAYRARMGRLRAQIRAGLAELGYSV